MGTKAEDPLFQSTHEAMRFATNFNHAVVPRSSMNQMMAPASGSGRGIGGLDGAGQAGIILREALELGNPTWYSCMYARVAPVWLPCDCKAPCCSGKVPNFEWRDAIGWLTESFWALQDQEREEGKRGITYAPLLHRDLILKYFGDQTKLIDLTFRHEVTSATVTSRFSMVKRILRKQEKDAWEALDHRLRDLGIVGDKETIK